MQPIMLTPSLCTLAACAIGSFQKQGPTIAIPEQSISLWLALKDMKPEGYISGNMLLKKKNAHEHEVLKKKYKNHCLRDPPPPSTATDLWTPVCASVLSSFLTHHCDCNSARPFKFRIS